MRKIESALLNMTPFVLATCALLLAGLSPARAAITAFAICLIDSVCVVFHWEKIKRMDPEIQTLRRIFGWDL